MIVGPVREVEGECGRCRGVYGGEVGSEGDVAVRRIEMDRRRSEEDGRRDDVKTGLEVGEEEKEKVGM